MTVHSLRRVLALSALAALLAVAAATFLSTGRADAAENDQEVCHAPLDVTEHHLAKHTRTRTFDWQTWSWGDWSEPELWTPISHDEWVTDILAAVWQPHASGLGWEREWAVLPFEERTVTVDGDRIPCDPQPPAGHEETTDTDCESGFVTTLTVDTTWELDADFVWQPVVVEASSQREATTEECPPATTTTTAPPRTYECDGTGDGVPDHDYNDPTDGVCAAEKAPTQDPPADTPVVVEAAAETLPVTGTPTGLFAAAGLTLLAAGAGLVRLVNRNTAA